MNRKRLIIIAVSIIAVIVVVAAIIFAVKGSNSKEEYTDTVVTEVVTDENGETVTDENGDAVTVVVTEKVTDKDGETVTDNNGNAVTEKVTTKTTTTAANNNDSGNNSNSSNNSGNNNNNDSDNDDDDDDDDEKPKSRKVTVDVVLPYYNKQETEITVSYRVVGDKDYKKLDPVKVKLDKTGKKESFDLGKLKGDVEVVVSFSGITISENSIVISAKDDSGEIKPVTGIEIIEGQDD